MPESKKIGIFLNCEKINQIARIVFQAKRKYIIF